MSKFVQIQTQLRQPEMIKRALDKLQLSYTEDKTYVHRWSGSRHVVPLLVQSGSLRFGFRPTDDGNYEVVADDMQMRKIQSIVDQVSQQYAYAMVLEETAKAGFNLVEESIGNDDTIRLTVRRWN